MSAAQPFPGFEERDEPRLGRAIALAFAVHLVLIAMLLVGVRWQSHSPAPMMVELWRAQPAKPATKPVPPPPPKPVPKVEPAPPPPKPTPPPEPKPEPRIEKPDIAVKEPPKPKPPPPKPEAKPKPPPKPVAKPVPKPAPPKDDEYRKQLQQQQQQLATEQAAISAQRQEAALRQLLAAEAASDRSKALASWVDKIRVKIRGNIVLPPAIKGNPEAVFEITLLPTGEVLRVDKKKSSGLAVLDNAIDRAINKSSPLPMPDDPKVFERRLEITYRPFDDR